MTSFKVKLLRNTTYKCGRIQRAIVSFLRRQGRVVLYSSLSELRGKVGVDARRYHFNKALNMLQRRFIVEVT